MPEPRAARRGGWRCGGAKLQRGIVGQRQHRERREILGGLVVDALCDMQNAIPMRSEAIPQHELLLEGDRPDVRDAAGGIDAQRRCKMRERRLGLLELHVGVTRVEAHAETVGLERYRPFEARRGGTEIAHAREADAAIRPDCGDGDGCAAMSRSKSASASASRFAGSNSARGSRARPDGAAPRQALARRSQRLAPRCRAIHARDRGCSAVPHWPVPNPRREDSVPTPASGHHAPDSVAETEQGFGIERRTLVAYTRVVGARFFRGNTCIAGRCHRGTARCAKRVA
jgi:hypothetical protein